MTDNRNNKIWFSFFHSNEDYEKVLNSESGSFFVDDKGIVQRFEPAANNPFIEEETKFNDNYTYTTHKSIRTLIVPSEVKGFASDFMRDTRVLERFELPDGLLGIGNNSFGFDTKCNCVFANCILPSVVIPRSVTEIGIFAFGDTHIDTLQLTATLHSPYGRQFKDSYIGTLKLPKEWKDDVSIEDGRLEVYHVLNSNDFGYLQWPSTYVKRLEFY